LSLFVYFFSHASRTTALYTLSLHDALPIFPREPSPQGGTLLVGRRGRVEHQKIPSGAVTDASSAGGTVTVSPPSSSAVSSGSRWATSRKRSTSAGSSTPSARVRNFATYCSRPKGRAPRGWASATAISSTTRVPSVRVISTRPPKAFSAGSVEW